MFENEESPSESWSSILSRVAKNTASSVRSSTGRRLLTTYAVLQSLPQFAAASICFEGPNAQDYTLDCGITGQAGHLWQLLTSACHTYQDGGDDCANWFTSTLDFGSGWFGGSTCTLTYHSFDVPNECVVQILSDNVKNGVTLLDLTCTIFIGLIGITAITVITRSGCRLYDRYSQNQGEYSPLVLEEDAPNLLVDDEFQSLLARVGDILEVKDENITVLHQDLIAFEDNYTCGITLEILSKPVTLECLHTFEEENIKEVAELDTCCCPTCRTPISDDFELVVNEVIQLEISAQLNQFSQRLDGLEAKIFPDVKVVIDEASSSEDEQIYWSSIQNSSGMTT